MKRAILPLLVLLFVSLACQIGFNLPTQAPATQEATEAVPTATMAPTLTSVPTRKSSASPTPAARATATPPQATPIVLPAGGEQPVLITGDFTYSNSFVVETYFVEQAVALMDMHGFVVRDRDWELPVESQVLGYLKIDTTRKRGTYRLQLPAIPGGMYSDFSNSGGKKPGVQIFTVAYSPNMAGGPFAEGDDRQRGWPSYLASVVTDTDNKDEVLSGKLVVWAPDDQEQFPTAFGADGLLFTADDPLGALPAGYSVIDLDQKPFAIGRELNPKLTLYEPKDVAIKDYSKLSYSAAFQNMFDFLKNQYAFNGIQGKEPAWDSLYAAIMPRVKEAEQKKDASAYYAALSDFTLGFKDGHVSIDGGETGNSVIVKRLANGYGFAIRELDDKRVIVVYVTRNGPAAAAGLAVGDEILSYNNTPIGEAIGSVQVLSPESSDFALRYEQAHFLLRAAAVGSPVTITFKNRAGASKTVTLKAVAERGSYSATSIFRNFDSTALPVEFRILDSGSGYIKVNSNYDDLNLIIRLFERGLKTFVENGVDNLIIDMRANSGGTPLGLAGYLTNQEIPLGTLEYYNSKTGKFEPDRETDKFTPNENQYRFKKMALLVDQACFSACEIEAYGFSQLPGMQVVGMFPTGGVEAEVARGQFELPAGMQAQFPTGRFVLPDGSLFLEGQGVRPTVRVPITAENVLSQNDVVLQAAEGRLK